MYTNRDLYILTESIKNVSSGFNFITLKLEDEEGCVVDYERIIEEEGYEGALFIDNIQFFMATFFMELKKNKKEGPEMFVTIYKNGDINVSPTSNNKSEFNEEKIKEQIKEVLMFIKEEEKQREIKKRVNIEISQANKKSKEERERIFKEGERISEVSSRKIEEILRKNRNPKS